MSYSSNGIPNIRTIKAYRGEALKIDLGKEFQGTLESWMKRTPNSDIYRPFEVQDGRYLYLSKDLASDYTESGVVVDAIGGKWYFDVEQDLNDGSDVKTIYRGTIYFQDDITGSNGSEGIPPPTTNIGTNEVGIIDATIESISGNASTQKDANIEFSTEIKLLKQNEPDLKPYKFDEVINGSPNEGYLTLNSDEFVSTTLIKINQIDLEGLDNSYLFDKLNIGGSLVLRGQVSGADAVFTIENLITESLGIFSIPVTHDNSIGGMLEDDESVDIEGLSSSTESVLERTIVVAGIQDDTIGVNNGDTLEAGISITDSLEKILIKRIAPVYTEPTSSLSVSPSSTQEIADSVNYTLTPSFVQNDGGVYTSIVFKRNGTVLHTQNDLSAYVDTNRTIIAGSVSYSVEIDYSEGAIKDDNLGDPDPTGQIQAGTTTSSKSVSGQYRNWFGENGALPPTNGNDIRSLGFTYNSTFTLNTGSTSLVHVIAIPSTNTLESVIDEDALNANITANYILSGTITTVPDGGGNNVSYNVYILTLAQAYSSSHRHNIIIN